jgi:hypothetical protein
MVSAVPFGLSRLTNTSQPNICPVIPFVPRSETRCPDVPSNNINPILLAVPMLTVVAVANGSLAAVATSAVPYGAGGMMKSDVDVTVP